MLPKLTLIIVATLILSACNSSSGSGASNNVTTAKGQFKDNNTAGLSYTSGNQSGVTDSDGTFSYQVGQKVTFSVGGIKIGESTGKTIVTPIDLVSQGNSDSTAVKNIVRFLMMLDDDGNPENGIKISESVAKSAKNWQQVNFATTNLGNDLKQIMEDAKAADGRTRTLPTAEAAKTHLEKTLRCSYAGAYAGKYSGDDDGYFIFLVDALNGNSYGGGYRILTKETFILNSNTPISYDQNVTFVSGNASTGATFKGQYSSVNKLTGTWENSQFNLSGTFSGARIGGLTNAKYRFTGQYIGTSYGAFALDLNSANKVTGYAYNIINNTSVTLTGTVTGTALQGKASDGTSFTGTLNTATGELKDGKWSNQNESGTFVGSGCKLN